MYYYDLFMQGPGVYIPVLLFSLIITMLAYGAFPLIFSSVRKNQITKKKFTLLCYGINLLVMIAFIAFGSKSSGAPYMLWTWIFSSVGIRKLDARGIFNIRQVNSLSVNEENFENNSNRDTNESKKETNLSNRNKKIIIDIINICLLIASIVLCQILPNYYDSVIVLNLCFGIVVVIFKFIGVFIDKINIVTCIINITLLSLMLIVSCGEFDPVLIITFVFVLYNLLYELYIWIGIIFDKYHATQRYKIKCYKKIEQLNTYCEKGIITEDEYEKTREQIMSKIRY